MLCKKQLQESSLPVPVVVAGSTAAINAQPYSHPSMGKKAGNGGSWKAWLNKSFNFKISSH